MFGDIPQIAVPDAYQRPSIGMNLTMSSGRIYPSRTIQILHGWCIG